MIADKNTMHPIWRLGQNLLEGAALAAYLYYAAVLLVVRDAESLLWLMLVGSVGWGCLALRRLRSGRWRPTVLFPGLLALLSLGLGVLALLHEL